MAIEGVEVRYHLAICALLQDPYYIMRNSIVISSALIQGVQGAYHLMRGAQVIYFCGSVSWGQGHRHQKIGRALVLENP